MAIITISRGTLSGGKALSECLVKCLGYRFLDRDMVIGNASACGASEEKLREAIERPPNFWDHFSEEKSHYMIMFQACLSEQAKQDGLVYLGNAGHLLLHGISHVIRVRIIAPLEFRIREVQQKFGMNREKSVAYIEKQDHDRAKWTKFLYGVDWSDPALYDVVLNLQRFTIEEGCRFISAMAKEKSFLATPESLAAISNFALSCRVKAALLLNHEIEPLLIDVTAHNGVVELKGKVRTRKQWEMVESTARNVSGVERLVTDELVQALDR